ncbi:MAG: hypothetical protein Q9219_005905 [cf. Caloplaca sp. 3 TL-2023]
MSQYEKLTVAKLRDELTKRGLPKTGLKAALIQRLVEADEESGHDTPEAADPGDSEPNLPKNNDEEPSSPLPAAAKQPTEQSGEAVTGEKQKDTTPPSDHPQETTTIPADTERNRTSPIEHEGVSTEVSDPNGNDLETSRNHDSAKKASESKGTAHDPPEATLNSDKPHTKPGTNSSLVAPIDADKPTQNGSATPVSQQGSSTNEETIEDMKKRKRRSSTPPPSIESVQKKAKIGDGRPVVKLPEDTSMEDVNATPAVDVPVKDVPTVDEPGEPKDVIVEDAPAVEEVAATNDKPEDGTDKTEVESLTEQSVEAVGDPPKEPEEKLEPEEESKDKPRPKTPEDQATKPEPEPSTAPTQSPAKPAPADARFRNILRRDSSPVRPPPKNSTEDRTVSPALHPATTALYIRNILRPLHVENLKDHLIDLGTPSDRSPDPSIIADFFLDSIRTHALVRFSTVAAASRVRTGLHDRVWPEEKNRKPLWVDFVPEEKLPKWFEVENSSSGRGQMAKRWEVVYENEEDGVKAYLQEAGSNGSNAGVIRPSQAPAASSRSNEVGPIGVRGAPSGPRLKEREQPNGPPPSDRGRGFQALDDLFRSTAAKPKVYYLPVAKRIAEKRLDKLAEGRGGGRGGDEMRRYSFEETTIVDRGPEFGARGGRGGGYGGRGGGYSGRGGYRGDFRGDYRRDRR